MFQSKEELISIMLDIVSSIFPVRHQDIQLRFEYIGPLTVALDKTHTPNLSNAESYQQTMWGFCIKRGFIRITEGDDYKFVKVSDYLLKREDESRGESLQEHPEIDNLIFFLLCSKGGKYGENGFWELQECPDIEVYFEYIKKEDVERWKQWIKK